MASRKKAQAQKRAGAQNIRESLEMPGLAENSASATVAQQMAKRKTLTVMLRIAVFGMVPLIFLLACVMYLDISSRDVDEREVDSMAVNSTPGKAAAIGEVQAWLASDPSPLPNGVLVSWDGFEERAAPQPVTDAETRQSYVEQLHIFTLRANDRLYTSQVLVMVDGVGVKSVDTPTLLPRPTENVSQWQGEVPWFGFQTNNPREEVQTAIEEWASAYISGSPRFLKQAVGDPEGDRSYVPLTGVETVERVEVLATGVPAPQTQSEKEDWEEPDWLIARVQLTVEWKGEVYEDHETPNRTPITFDVMVEKSQSASPVVVSWGGAGSGPDLSAYSVGLDGVKLSEPNENQVNDEFSSDEEENSSGDQ